MSTLELFDLSSPFDTIDHYILAHRLYTEVRFTNTVLQWHYSYLTDHTQYVSLSIYCAAFDPAHSCVPQGSVFCHMHYSMHIRPLSTIIDPHSVMHI